MVPERLLFLKIVLVMTSVGLYHLKLLCMGVSAKVTDAIREASGVGVEFVCTQCRAHHIT